MTEVTEVTEKPAAAEGEAKEEGEKEEEPKEKPKEEEKKEEKKEPKPKVEKPPPDYRTVKAGWVQKQGMHVVLCACVCAVSYTHLTLPTNREV